MNLATTDFEMKTTSIYENIKVPTSPYLNYVLDAIQTFMPSIMIHNTVGEYLTLHVVIGRILIGCLDLFQNEIGNEIMEKEKIMKAFANRNIYQIYNKDYAEDR